MAVVQVSGNIKGVFGSDLWNDDITSDVVQGTNLKIQPVTITVTSIEDSSIKAKTLCYVHKCEGEKHDIKTPTQLQEYINSTSEEQRQADDTIYFITDN